MRIIKIDDYFINIDMMTDAKILKEGGIRIFLIGNGGTDTENYMEFCDGPGAQFLINQLLTLSDHKFTTPKPTEAPDVHPS